MPVNKLHVVLIIFASFLLVGCSVLSDVLGPIVSGMEDEGDPGAYIIEGPPDTLPAFSYPAGEKALRHIWYYRPPETDEEMPLLASLYDMYIFDYSDRNFVVPLRRKMDEANPVLLYMLMEGVKETRTCVDAPWTNQVADLPGDYCWLSERHADWFLVDTEGNRLIREWISDNRTVQMDPANAEWRAFFLERTADRQFKGGFDGVFLDNVDASYGRVRSRSGVDILANFPNETAYQAGVEGFLKYIYESYFFPNDIPLYGNITFLEDEAVWHRYMQYMDGAMLENWSVDWGGG